MKCRIVDYSRPPISNTKMKNNIKRIISDSGFDISITEIIIRMYDYMIDKKFFGACHVISSVLYVGLSEMEFNTKLFIGECKKEGEKPFDHSWITVNDKIIDLAIYFPLTGKINSVSGPVIFDIDAVNMNTVQTSYGINTGLQMSMDTQVILNTPFDEYMDKYPKEQDGLWSILKKVLPDSYNFDLETLRRKYANTTRQFVR